MTLGVAPTRFNWVEFRGVAWQPFKLKPLSMILAVPSYRRAMCIQTIPHDDYLVAQVVMQLPQKLDYLFRYETICRELKIKRRMFVRRGQCQCTDCRHSPIMLCRNQLQWCMSTWRPRALPVRLQQKACFVDKNDASFVAKPPFLYGAIRIFSNARRSPESVLAPDAVASGTTSPIYATVGTRNFHRMLPRNVSRSLQRHAGTSKVRWQNHLPTHPVREFAPHNVAGCPLIAAVCPGEVLTPMHRSLPAQRPSANGPHKSTMQTQVVRPPRATCPLKTSSPQSVALLPIPKHFLWSSC
jgi:hypothetical protein